MKKSVGTHILFVVMLSTMAIMCSSCIAGLSNSAAHNANLAQTEVVLARNNYRIVGAVRGECTQNYWFGIGGLSKKSLSESAISEMYRNANLSGSQAVINVNVVYKNKFILIHSQTKAIATGTVIEFTD